MNRRCERCTRLRDVLLMVVWYLLLALAFVLCLVYLSCSPAATS